MYKYIQICLICNVFEIVFSPIRTCICIKCFSVVDKCSFLSGFCKTLRINYLFHWVLLDICRFLCTITNTLIAYRWKWYFGSTFRTAPIGLYILVARHIFVRKQNCHENKKGEMHVWAIVETNQFNSNYSIC